VTRTRSQAGAVLTFFFRSKHYGLADQLMKNLTLTVCSGPSENDDTVHSTSHSITMKRHNSRKVLWGVVALGLIVAGCSSLRSNQSLRPISSKPPESAIVLNAPAIVSESGTITTFPVGEYRPAYEDRSGYYFRAPTKVLVDDVAVFAREGGLYVARGDTEPARWYVIGENGSKKMGSFKKIPQYKRIP
jgi:hypothetical protein